MAEIRKVVRREALSDFQRVAPEGGGAFRALAQLADTAYEYLKPAAIQEMTTEGAALGRDIARQQIGNPRSGIRVTAGGSPSSISDSLSRTESGGNYQAQNSEGFVGKYQWGQARLDDFNRANGSNISMADFKADPGVQEQAQAWHESDILTQLGGYVGRTVNGILMTPGAIVGMAHLGGVGGARKFIETNGEYDPADSNGTNLSDYARAHGSAGMANATGQTRTTYAPTILREADGSLTSRLFSPMGGEILQAHNAAAGVAYQSEQLLQADIDMMGLSDQFALDPEGFQQAATAYLKDRVDKAPAMFREDLRNSIERDVQRRFLGILEDRQADTRKRADNSSAALADRWAGNLSSAIASGNPEEIATARAELESVLIARESLPGVAWTRVQSENAVMDAERRGQEAIAKRSKDASDEQKGYLRTVIDAAKNGLHSAYEGLIADPSVAAAHPELAAEAQAQIALRDAMPSFFASPKADRDKAIADLKETPISEGFQVDIVGAAEKAGKTIDAAWEEDPIATASQYLPQKPPALPSPDSPNLVEGLAARHEYGLMLRDKGFTDTAIFLSDDEAKNLGALMSKDIPPEARAAVAGAIVAGFGSDAVQVFSEIKSDDPTTRYAGMLMASGQDAATSAIATEAMRGQSLIDERMVQPPTKAATVAAIDPNIAAALSAIPGATKTESDLIGFATAIYAARAGNLDPSSEQAKSLMAQSVQAALGQSTDKRGNITGGVQVVGGNPVLLPIGVSGEKLEARMSEAFGHFKGGWDAFGSIWGETRKADANVWAAAGVSSQKPPMLGGEPLSASLWTSGDLKLIPVSKNIYRMEYHSAGGGVSHPRDEFGNVYFMDLSVIMDPPPKILSQSPNAMNQPSLEAGGGIEAGKSDGVEIQGQTVRTMEVPNSDEKPKIERQIEASPTEIGRGAGFGSAPPLINGDAAPPKIRKVAAENQSDVGDSKPNVDGLPSGRIAKAVQLAQEILGPYGTDAKRLSKYLNGTEMSARDEYKAASEIIKTIKNLPNTKAKAALLADLYEIRNSFKGDGQ